MTVSTPVNFRCRRGVPRLCGLWMLAWASLLPGLATAEGEVSFERVQLSDQFYSEGGTHGDYDGDGFGDVAVGPWIYYGPGFTSRS